jgi:hypothetical protein
MGYEAFLPSIVNSIGARTRGDITDEFKAAPNVATGLGAATRAAVVSPASYTMETMANVGAPARSAIGDFATGLFGTPAPKPVAAAPRAPATFDAAKNSAGVYTPNENPADTQALAESLMPHISTAIAAPRSVRDIPYIGRQANPIAGLFATSAATRQAAALNTMNQRDFRSELTAAKGNQALEAGDLDLESKRDDSAIRAAAAAGDEKAMEKLRNIRAAMQGKSPGEAVNEKLLDSYLKSVGEFNKDPSNMGKAAPSFQDFLGALPPGMFPNVSKYAPALPSGMKRQVGTSGGKPVYEDAKGQRYTIQ